jgi:hypothetical protein
MDTSTHHESIDQGPQKAANRPYQATPVSQSQLGTDSAFSVRQGSAECRGLIYIYVYKYMVRHYAKHDAIRCGVDGQS